jgi:hypothetical protein
LARLEGKDTEQPVEEGNGDMADTNPWRRRAREAARAWEIESERRARTRSSRAVPQRLAAGEAAA